MIVFDIDGTILPGTSCERLFVKYLVRAKVLRLRNLLSFCTRGIVLLPDGLSHCTKANKGYLCGFAPEYVAELGSRFYNEAIAPRISQKAVRRIEAYIENGDEVVLFSGMPEFLLRNFATALDIEKYLGSVMEISDGRFTGVTRKPFPLGKGKIEALKPVVAEAGVSWSDITFYADHWLDRFLLARVGHPVAVNPKPRLLRLANMNGWDIEIFD